MNRKKPTLLTLHKALMRCRDLADLGLKCICKKKSARLSRRYGPPFGHCYMQYNEGVMFWAKNESETCAAVQLCSIRHSILSRTTISERVSDKSLLFQTFVVMSALYLIFCGNNGKG